MTPRARRFARRALGAAGLAGVLAAAASFAPLTAWWANLTETSRADAGRPAASSASSAHVPRLGGHATDEPPLPVTRFPDEVLAALRTVLEGYDDVHGLLVADSVEGVGPPAERIAKALAGARAGATGAPSAELERGERSAADLATARDVVGARRAFESLSRSMIRLAAADSRLAHGRHVFTCPMTEGPGRWLQTSDELANPYMGQKMLRCGSSTPWVEPAPSDHAAAEPHDETIAYFTCPMHPSVRQATAGACPICGMDLVGVTKGEIASGTVRIDAERRQLIGVKVGAVERRTVDARIRTLGRVVYDESRIHDVTLKVRGWVERLAVNATGQRVRRGQTLMTVYSPEVYGAQLDLLAAARTRRGPVEEGVGGTDAMVESARARLRLWDVSSRRIDEVLRAGVPDRATAVTSPISGFVVEKDVVEGGAFEAGTRLMRLVDLERVWVEADVYESDMARVAVGQKASVGLPYVPGRRFEGTVAFVYPYLDGSSRTGRARIEIANPSFELKPDMFANVEIDLGPREVLQVPSSAVVYAGPRRIVFVDEGEGRLRPKEVEVGARSGDDYEITSGLAAGDRVVTSGNFLVAAESRLKAAEATW